MRLPLRLLNLIVLLLLSLTACKDNDNGLSGQSWQLTFEENFDSESSLEGWHLDGFANLRVVSGDNASYLEIETYPSKDNPENKQSVLWQEQRFSGDLRFRFRARATDKNRSIFFFNATPNPDAGFDKPFDRNLPDAQYERYAAESGMGIYTIGILRSDESSCNLRYIGGSTAGAYREYMKNPGAEAQAVFGAETIFQSYDSPFESKPNQWFEFDISVVGDSIRLAIDGQEIFKCKDPGNVGNNEYPWKPLTDGGWLAFRNFVPGVVCVDYLKVYTRK